jgi:hypothetical protein
MNNFKLYLNTFLNNNKIKSQYDYYKTNNANEVILNLISLESKKFGSIMEKMILEIFNFDKRINSQHDAIFQNLKIEIKCARYWNHTNDCKWQHIEKTYDYDLLLLILIDFQDIKIWSISKNKLFSFENINNKIINKQGNQGYWITKNKILNQLYLINSKNDLINFIHQINNNE